MLGFVACHYKKPYTASENDIERNQTFAQLIAYALTQDQHPYVETTIALDWWPLISLPVAITFVIAAKKSALVRCLHGSKARWNRWHFSLPHHRPGLYLHLLDH